MNVQLFTMQRNGPGIISTMARPRGGEWLDDEMADLRSKGVTTLVSFLTTSEIMALDLTAEVDAAERAGIRFISFPISDLSISATVEAYKTLLDEVEPDIRNGGHVVGHCRMGIGRASMFAAALLVREGVSADEAWATVSEARGLAVPDTDVQRAWVSNFASTK